MILASGWRLPGVGGRVNDSRQPLSDRGRLQGQDHLFTEMRPTYKERTWAARIHWVPGRNALHWESFWNRSRTWCNANVLTGATRDGYRVKTSKPPPPPSGWSALASLPDPDKQQSVTVGPTCSKFINDKNLHGKNLAKARATPMDCVCKLCGGADSQ